MVYHSLRERIHRLQSHLPRYLQPDCLLCGGYSGDAPALFGLCRWCHDSLPLIGPACHRCGLPLPTAQAACGECLQQPPAFDRTCCPLTFTGITRPLVHRFKTRHQPALCRLLADLLLARLPPAPDIDQVVAVPMHWRRNLQRGNNHSYLLATVVASRLQLPANQHLLQRRQHTPAQKALSAEQRRCNLQQAFRCSADVRGLRIAVVDDVMTTGSTLDAIADTLKQAGALEVQCWVVARTPKLAG